MKRIALLIALFALLGSSIAAPVTFKCVTSEGTPVADLVVDIQRKTIVWGGVSKYTIRATDDRYISAYEDSGSSVGGEVWVLNRITGQYLRAGVSIAWNSIEAARTALKNNDPGKISAQTYSGQCSRPLL